MDSKIYTIEIAISDKDIERLNQKAKQMEQEDGLPFSLDMLLTSCAARGIRELLEGTKLEKVC